MAVSDLQEPEALHRVPQFTSVLLLGLASVGCGGAQPGRSTTTVTECVPGGELVASVYGHREAELDWRGSELDCEGMRRPRGQGARLRFEGPVPAIDEGPVPGNHGEAARLAFIIALPELAEGQTGSELPAGVTLMEVDEGRFFSSPEQAGCWADVERHERLESGDWRIGGIVYCVSPLAEINGASSISIRDLRFTGRLDWSEPE